MGGLDLYVKSYNLYDTFYKTPKLLNEIYDLEIQNISTLPEDLSLFNSIEKAALENIIHSVNFWEATFELNNNKYPKILKNYSYFQKRDFLMNAINHYITDIKEFQGFSDSDQLEFWRIFGFESNPSKF